MKRHRHILTVVALLALIAGHRSLADDILDYGPKTRYVEEKEKQQELGVRPPPYPEDGDLLEVEIPQLGGRLSYALDGKNLSVDIDGVVRYTVVIESSGARNVFFEGMDCRARRYKTYAYGHGGDKFRQRQDPQWQRIVKRGSQAFREELRHGYFCDRFGYARPLEEIVKLLHGERTLDL